MAQRRHLTTSKRLVAGAVAGLAATAFMDLVGSVFWERAMGFDARKREREVEPRFPLVVLAERIAKKMRPSNVRRATSRISAALHWGVGLSCGATHGLIEERFPQERRRFALPVVAMMLAVDEFAFPAASLSPWPWAFPWQTHARAVTAHLAYGICLAVFYEGIKSYGS